MEADCVIVTNVKKMDQSIKQDTGASLHLVEKQNCQKAIKNNIESLIVSSRKGTPPKTIKK